MALCQICGISGVSMMYNVNPCSMSNKPIESRIESLMAIMKEKISTIDNCEHTAQLLNATLFLHQIDERSRRISDMAYYQKVKGEIRRYIPDGTYNSPQTCELIFLLKSG